jgi:alkyldihydroxyacetonephosphate synthase
LSTSRRKHWGWGLEHEQPSREQLQAAASGLFEHLGFTASEVEEPVELERVTLREPRVTAPARLREICSVDRHPRATHALGKSYCDVVRGFRGQFEHPPDFVARPRTTTEVEQLLEWCSQEQVAAIPYGGGTSVVGGVTPDVAPSYNGAISIDLGALDRVLELDPVSRSAHIQAGASGPGLEGQLAEQGFALRHFPQSYELSTLGGWIATRAAGHFATLWTHIEDLVESVGAITPTGEWVSRRVPGSGAGPSPDRMLVGSEGALGVIVDAWVRVQPRPSERASAAVCFDDFAAGAECVRALSQSGLHPSNCRLIDAEEARFTLAGDGSAALLVLGFESYDHPVEHSMKRALAICAEHGGATGRRLASSAGAEQASAVVSHSKTGASRAGAHTREHPVEEAGRPASADAVGVWRQAFLGAPYVRDVLVAMGVLSETFETAITWERFPAFHERVTNAANEALRGLSEEGRVTCRFTHVYPDGPAPYYTVLARAKRGEEIEQWQAIKRAVSDVVIAEGGTITHHHAVGRDHRPWYDRQRPEPFATALRGAKAAVDPAGIMNPGVLL